MGCREVRLGTRSPGSFLLQFLFHPMIVDIAGTRELWRGDVSKEPSVGKRSWLPEDPGRKLDRSTEDPVNRSPAGHTSRTDKPVVTDRG